MATNGIYNVVLSIWIHSILISSIMVVRFFLLLFLLFSTNGQFIVWDTAQQVWCTDWRTLSALDSVLTEPCNNIRVCLFILSYNFLKKFLFIFYYSTTFVLTSIQVLRWNVDVALHRLLELIQIKFVQDGNHTLQTLCWKWMSLVVRI